MLSPISGKGEPALPAVSDAARKRAALETFVQHEATLRRTARRYSICHDDAEDALQRGLEILLTKAPSEDPRELIRWTQTVVKHEALAIRRERERTLSGPAAYAREEGEDWVGLIPSRGDGPPEQVERREAIARSREALRALKPPELRALTLLAEGYSYAEIGEITGYSHTKVNRALAEGRERFRRLLARSEGGERCAELGPLLSAFCDGEASAEQAAELREHLRACANCRATLRAYRAAPRAAAALTPTLPAARSLLDRAHEALAGLAARFGGAGSSDSALSQVAAGGGTRGAGAVALAKLAALCIGTAGGAAACVATGVVPAPLGLADEARKVPLVKEGPRRALDSTLGDGVDYEPVPVPPSSPPATGPDHDQDPAPPATPAPAHSEPAATSGAVEYTPEPAPSSSEPTGSTASAAPRGGSAAGEFGP